MFEWECDPARDGRLTIAEYREQFREKVGRRAAISGHMGPKRGTATNLVKVRCTLDQVFDSFAIFTLDGGKRGKTARLPENMESDTGGLGAVAHRAAALSVCVPGR